MAAKFVFLVGVLGVGGYAYNKAANYDPNVYALSREQAQTILASSSTTIPRRTNDGFIKIWGAGTSEKGASLNMRYAEDAPLLECQAVITEVAPDQSRVIADCGASPDSSDAIASTTQQLRRPMFEEHIQSTLHKRPFNRDNATRKETAIAMSNMGGMQREALKRSDEAQAAAAEASE
jgi:hypothetical protein